MAIHSENVDTVEVTLKNRSKCRVKWKNVTLSNHIGGGGTSIVLSLLCF